VLMVMLLVSFINLYNSVDAVSASDFWVTISQPSEGNTYSSILFVSLELHNNAGNYYKDLTDVSVLSTNLYYYLDGRQIYQENTIHYPSGNYMITNLTQGQHVLKIDGEITYEKITYASFLGKEKEKVTGEVKLNPTSVTFYVDLHPTQQPTPISSSTVTQTDKPTCNIQTITKTMGFGDFYFVSLALDSQGNPHISYYDEYHGINGTIRILKYASWNISAWNIQTIDSIRVYDTSIALDSKNNPHLSYITPQGLEYAIWNGSTWNIQTVDKATSDKGNKECSLALDSKDSPHIAYIKYELKHPEDDLRLIYSSSELRYADWNGSAWNIQFLAGASSSPSLALDSQGNPHISYCHAGLWYAGWNGSNWSIQLIDTVCSSASLALDSAGNPHISYEGKDGLKYASWTCSTWKIQTIDSTSGNTYISLALDSKDNPKISYQNSGLRYAFWNGSGWSIQIVDSGGDYNSLDLDSQGNPHISYVNDGLKYVNFASASVGAQTNGFSKMAMLLSGGIAGALIVCVALLVIYRKVKIEKLDNRSEEAANKDN
jgi:hypothetical protein